MKTKKLNSISKVCIISDSFIPKKISAAGMIYNLSVGLVSRNIEVVCLFGSSKTDLMAIKSNQVPNYDLTNITFIGSSFMNSLRNGSYFFRFSFEIILALSLSFKILKNKNILQDIDLIICYCPSAFLWMPSLVLKLITKSPVYLILRDIFPDWLINVGIIKNKFLFSFLTLISYPQFLVPNIIGCESKSDTDFIKNKNKKKIVETLYNWPSLNEKLINLRELNNLDFMKYYKTNKNDNDTLGVYTGNDSLSHDLTSGLSFLKNYFKAHNKSSKLIVNIFSSQTTYANSLQNQSKCFLEKNWDMLPEYYLPKIYTLFDFGIVSLNIKHKTNNLPGKFISYIQFGLPVLCFVNNKSDLSIMVNNYDCGCIIDLSESNTKNYKVLSNFLMHLDKNKQKYKKNSLKLFQDFFSLDNALKKIMDFNKGKKSNFIE